MSTTEHAGDRRCGSCGHLAAPDDDFCTRCGTNLDDATNVLHLGVTPPLSSAAVPVPRSGRAAARGAGVACGLPSRSRSPSVSVACVALAVATITSRQDLSDTRSELEASQAQVTTLKKSRAGLAAELSATRDLSRRRAAVLLRANRVLEGGRPAALERRRGQAERREGAEHGRLVRRRHRRADRHDDRARQLPRADRPGVDRQRSRERADRRGEQPARDDRLVHVAAAGRPVALQEGRVDLRHPGVELLVRGRGAEAAASSR